MSKAVRNLLIISAILFISGIILAFSGYAVGGFDLSVFADFSTEETEVATLVMDHKIESVCIDAHNDKIKIIPTDEPYASITVYNKKYSKYTLSAENGVLKAVKEKKFHWALFSFDFKNYEAEVKIPRENIINVDVKTSNGKITVADLKFREFDIKTSNGNIYLENMEISQDAIIKTSNGSINIQNVKTENKIDMKTSNGKIDINNAEFGNESYATSSNGSIYARNITAEASLNLKTSNGRIEADTVVTSLLNLTSSNGSLHATGCSAGIYDFKTSNSSIDFTLSGDKNDYNYNCKTSNSSVYIDGEKQGNNFIWGSGADMNVNAKTSNGRINIDFER